MKPPSMKVNPYTWMVFFKELMTELNPKQVQQTTGGELAGDNSDKSCTPTGPIIVIK